MTTCRLVKVTSDFNGQERLYEGTWRIDTEGSDYSVIGIRNAAASAQPNPLPALGDTLSLTGSGGQTDLDLGVFFRGAKLDYAVEEDGRNGYWVATGQWKTLNKNETPEDLNTPNPLDRPTKYFWEFEAITEPIEKGWCHTELPAINRGPGDPAPGEDPTEPGPIVNAAGTIFDAPLTRLRRRAILVMQKNFTNQLAPLIFNGTFDDTLNETAYFNFPQDHAAYYGIESSGPQNENGYNFVTLTLRVLLSREPLYKTVVNVGYDEIVNGVPMEIRDGDDMVSQPQPLNLAGQRLPRDVLGTTIDYRTSLRVPYADLEW